MKYLITATLVIISLSLMAQKPLTTFEKSNYLKTSTYSEGIAFYQALAESSNKVNMKSYGHTDSGKPLHLVLVSKDGDFDIASNRSKGNSILMINNAIHPGEPDGVEASQMLARDLIENKKLSKLLDNTLVAIIPFYNIGGALNRNTGSRTNQNGPDEKGFRGNARNFDLNRDFIKNDTKNSQSFTEIFHLLDPDVLIDTHVSNGADYQYVLTMVIPQSDKLGQPLQDYLNNDMMPSLFAQMQTTAYEMTPYVNVWGSTPDKGWSQFFDAPRYSSGYAALFQTIGFQSETHMLKSFEQRTKATYQFLLQTLIYVDKNGKKLQETRQNARAAVVKQNQFPIDWSLDRTDSTMIEFKGYAATYPESQISGLERLKYDRDQPFTMQVPYYEKFKPTVTVDRPEYYVIPQAWFRVIEALQRNGVKTNTIASDTIIQVEAYKITDYDSRRSPWEGHYFHNSVEVDKTTQAVQFRAGDIMVPVNQTVNRYIVETLEPQATDSFFRWNFFDSVLQMKEGYSAYVFEDEAVEILEANPKLKKEFEDKKASDDKFRSSSSAQLNFIWSNSEHLEPSYMQYPVYRIMK